MIKTDGKRDRFKIGLIIITAIWTGTLVLLVYLALWHENPAVEFLSVELLTPVAEADGELIFLLDWCQHTRAPRTISKTWRDGLSYTEPTVSPRAAPVGCLLSRIRWDVPHGLPAGEYMIGAEVNVDVNPLANRIERFEVGPIRIVEKTE